MLEVVPGSYKVHNLVSLNIIKGMLRFPPPPPFHRTFKHTFLIASVNFFFMCVFQFLFQKYEYTQK